MLQIAENTLHTFKKKTTLCCVTSVSRELPLFSTLDSDTLDGHEPRGQCHNYSPFERGKFSPGI